MKLAIPKAFRRILLINSPAFDTRLPWASWHQPVGLLKIGAYLKENGFEVKIIDCLQLHKTGRLPKEKQKSITIEKTKIDFWRIGLSPKKVISEIGNFQKAGWSPDLILVSVGMSFWWEATRELTQELKTAIQVPIWIGGAYPTYYYDHAVKHSGADTVIKGVVREALNFSTNFSLYSLGKPAFSGVHLLEKEPTTFVNEIKDKFHLGIKTFALFDSFIGPDEKETFLEALKALSKAKLLGIKFVSLGNISPRVIDNNVAKVLKALNFRHVFLHDDIVHSPQKIEYLSTWDQYQKCVNALYKAGFHERTDEIGAAVLIGLPKEDLSLLTRRVVKLSSIVGSVHLVPYQYTPATPEGRKYEKWLSQVNGHLDITKLNGRLFPLARLAGKSFDDYLEITRMVALLNSKFRSRTFDFLGDNLTGQMVRKSLANDLWKPALPLEEDNQMKLAVVEHDR